ncbi:MAG: AraC family transcriptional regulator [Sphingorhabdus sp.]
MLKTSWIIPSASTDLALPQWRELFARQLFELEIDSTAPDFHATLHQGRLGSTLATRLIAGPQKVRRTARHIARDSRSPAMDLVAVRSGTMQYRQGGREGQIGAGEALLLDRTMPYHFNATASCSLTMMFDHNWLMRWIPDPIALAGVKIDRHSGWARALAAILEQLDMEGLGPYVLPGGVISDQIGSLLSLAIGSAASREPCGNLIFFRLQQLVKDRAHEHDLCAGAAARELGVSTRTLYLACAKANASFNNILITERLERARAMLADKRLKTVSIYEIAFRSGFVEPSHFSRRFRQHFGCPPGRMRNHLHN